MISLYNSVKKLCGFFAVSFEIFHFCYFPTTVTAGLHFISCGPFLYQLHGVSDFSLFLRCFSTYSTYYLIVQNTTLLILLQSLLHCHVEKNMDYGIKTTYCSSVLDILINISFSVLNCKMGLYQQAHKSWHYD